MKIAYVIPAVLFSSLISCGQQHGKASTKVVIDRFTTKDEMNGMVEGLKSVNINLSVKDASYNENGRLEKIKGKVEFPDQSIATFNTESVGKIIITKELDSKDGGFAVVIKKRWL